MTEVARKQDELLDFFATEIEAFLNGGPNRKLKHLEEAEEAGLDPDAIANLADSWGKAEGLRVQREREAEAKPKAKVLGLRPLSMPRPANDEGAPKIEEPLRVSEKPRRAGRLAEKVAKINFHESDLAPDQKPLTHEEKQRELERLADMRRNEPIAYDQAHRDLAKRLCTTQVAVDKAVRIVLENRADEGEQSQATKLVAIGMGKNVSLWHGPDGAGYASVKVLDHWENYKIDGSAFALWLRDEYGQQHQCKVGQEWVPQVPGAGALRDAVASLEGRARFNRDECKPAIRVGGDYKTIWIDLGGPDWRVVRVTSEGWKVWPRADVAFVRSSTMLPIPEPQRGGSIKLLQRVMSVRPEEFVLVAAWQLQALNPEGPYPIMNVHGETGDGKSWTCGRIVMTVNPNSTPLRSVSRIEDLFIAARNNWTVGFDNLSWLSGAYSDALCSLATGIASGKRAHYTNDEEHAFTVKRPVLFNGIPVDLAQRSDLASRTIRLATLPIIRRRTEAELKQEFVEIWPVVFGALLDGLVGALRDWQRISVEDPARLIDFERFAEAGCRAMGFREWEFVDAYAANRVGSMALACEAHAVGRAIIAFMKGNSKGFTGQMSVLYSKLDNCIYKPTNLGPHDWPKSPTKLSTELRRLAKPLAAVGIICETDVDRRPEGTQQDVVLRNAGE
jgi:hypothetical protein